MIDGAVLVRWVCLDERSQVSADIVENFGDGAYMVADCSENFGSWRLKTPLGVSWSGI